MKRRFLNILKKIKEDRLIEAIFVVALSGILIYSLFCDPIIGKCDNGDFERMYGLGGLYNTGKSYDEIFDYRVHRFYLVNRLTLLQPWGPNWVFGVLITKICVFLTLPITTDINQLFNLSYQTIVYTALFVIAMLEIMKYNKISKPIKVVLGIYIILFFTDFNYISYFNSFFGEAATTVFFFLFIGVTLNLIAREKPKKWHMIVFFISSAAFLTSKTQQLPLLIFMIIIFIGIYYYYKEFRKLTLIAALIIVNLCGIVYISINNHTNMNNMYQAVFDGILVGSKTPEKDLDELGIDKKYVYLRNYGFYSKDNPVDTVGETMKNDVYSKMSSMKVLVFYLKHPDRMWEKIECSAKYAYDFFDVGASNFEKGKEWSGKWVNTFRTHLAKQTPQIHKNVFVFLVFSILYFIICLWYLIKDKRRESKLLSLLCIFILATGASQAVLPIIGSGRADLGKHIYLMNLSYDIMFGVALIWILSNIGKLIGKTNLFKRTNRNINSK